MPGLRTAGPLSQRNGAPLCGPDGGCKRGFPARNRAAQAAAGGDRLSRLCPLSSLSTAESRLVRLGFADRFTRWPRRSTGNGWELRTQPERKAGLSVPPGRNGPHEAKAGRLTKPPPCGSCGLAFSGCESGRLRKVPIGSPASGPGTGRREGSSGSDPSGRSGTRVGALPPVEADLRVRLGSGRTGLRPGSCEAAGSAASARTCRADLRPGRSRAEADPRRKLAVCGGGGWETPGFFRDLPSGEPPGLRP